MLQQQETIRVGVAGAGAGFVNITQHVSGFLGRTGITQGVMTVFCKHTSASLLIQENADPDVLLDLADWIASIAPHDPGRYRHSAEGPDDMPAHIRTAITQTHLSIPVTQGQLALGTWQGIYLFEHRDMPTKRQIVLHVLGT